MKTKFKSVFKCARHRAFLAFVVAFLSPLTGRAGSLWREAVTDERGMFADKRAHRLGDIVTVVVNETTAATNALTLNTTRAGTGDRNGLASGFINELINSVSNEQSAVPQGDRRKFPTNLLPKAPGKAPTILSTTGGSTTANTGNATSTQTLQSSMAVQVIDVLPNGNLVIEGIRQVSFSKERQFASLRGIIRPADVSATNTVASSAIADARIDVVAEGALSESQKKGWLTRLDEKISPY